MTFILKDEFFIGGKYCDTFLATALLPGCVLTHKISTKCKHLYFVKLLKIDKQTGRNFVTEKGKQCPPHFEDNRINYKVIGYDYK